jgi:hypothetical protein
MQPCARLSTMITETLASKIQRHIDLIPSERRVKPLRTEYIPEDDALNRLNDWAFCEGYGYVTRSSNTGYSIQVVCAHYQKETRNTRGLTEETRKRADTVTRKKACPHRVRIGVQKRLGGLFAYGEFKGEHNHPPATDPFELIPHRERDKDKEMAREIAETHRGSITYQQSSEILAKDGLELSRKDFYNVNWKAMMQKEDNKTITPAEELELIYTYLEDTDFRVEVREEVTYRDDGKTIIKRVIKDLFFIHPDQIQMAIRFISDFMYQTDATWDTSVIRLPLTNIVGVDNTMKTFGAASIFITSESAESGRFAQEQMQKHVFWCCRQASVVIGDFAAGLAKTFADKALQDAKEAQKTGRQLPLPPPHARMTSLEVADSNNDSDSDSGSDIPSDTIVVDPTFTAPDIFVTPIGGITTLQLCEWHAGKAMRKRLVKDKKYSNQKAKEIMTLLWAWIKCEDLDEVDRARRKLLAKLRASDRKYVQRYYQPKEYQFVRAYTNRLKNLGCHSTQRNEAFHRVAKQGLHVHLPLRKSVQVICKKILSQRREYERRINSQREGDRRLNDSVGFRECEGKITWESLDLARPEWTEAKRLSDRVDTGEDIFEFDPAKGCQHNCTIIIQFGIPCRHWMCYFFRRALPLPVSIFHPRWLYDWDEKPLKESWVIAYEKGSEDGVNREIPVANNLSTLATPNNDDLDAFFDFEYLSTTQPAAPSQILSQVQYNRFANRGASMITEAAHAVLDKLKDIPYEQSSQFALTVEATLKALLVKQDKITTAKRATPTELPAPIFDSPFIYRNKQGKVLLAEDRILAIREDEQRAKRRATQQAQAVYNEGQKIQKEMAEERQQQRAQLQNRCQSKDPFSDNYVIPDTTPSSLIPQQNKPHLVQRGGYPFVQLRAMLYEPDYDDSFICEATRSQITKFHNKAIPPDKTLLEMGKVTGINLHRPDAAFNLGYFDPYENTDKLFDLFRYTLFLWPTNLISDAWRETEFDPEFDGRDETGQLLVPYSREWETFSHPNPHNDDDINIDEDEVDLIPEPLDPILSTSPTTSLKPPTPKRPRRRIDYTKIAPSNLSLRKTRQPSAWKQAHDKEVKETRRKRKPRKAEVEQLQFELEDQLRSSQ